MDNDIPFTNVLALMGKDVIKSNPTIIKKRQPMYNIKSTIPPYSKPPHIQTSKSLMQGQILPEVNPNRNSMVTKARSKYSQCLSNETEPRSTSSQTKPQILKSTVPLYRKPDQIQMCRSEMQNQLVGKTKQNQSSLVPRARSRYSQYSVDQMKPRNTTSCYETKWSSKPIGKKYSKNTADTRNIIGGKIGGNQSGNIYLGTENQPHASTLHTVITVNSEKQKLCDHEVEPPSSNSIQFITNINSNNRLTVSDQRKPYRPPEGKSKFLEWLQNKRKVDFSKIRPKCEKQTIENEEDKKELLCNDADKKDVLENKIAEPVTKLLSKRLIRSEHCKAVKTGKGNSQFSEWLRNKKKVSVSISNTDSEMDMTWLTSQKKESTIKENTGCNSGISSLKNQGEELSLITDTDYDSEKTTCNGKNNEPTKNIIVGYDPEINSSSNLKKESSSGKSLDVLLEEWDRNWAELRASRELYEEMLRIIRGTPSGNSMHNGREDDQKINDLLETNESFETIHKPSENKNDQIDESVQCHESRSKYTVMALREHQRINRIYQKLVNPDERESRKHLLPKSKFPQWLKNEMIKAKAENKEFIVDISPLPVIEHKDHFLNYDTESE